MKKKIGLIAAGVLLIAAATALYFVLKCWPVRFRSELDAFFGKDNWKWVSSESKKSLIYTVYRSNKEWPGSYRTWDIAFTNRNGETEVWTITDHVMKINHDKHWIFSPGRYSAKQALTLELMDISFAMASEDVRAAVLESVLTKREVECLDVDISYRNGNPPPKMYDQLMKQPWFQANQITAANYLETELYDFYIRISIYDYRAKQLEEEERQHLLDSLDGLELALKEAYGEYADYEIYLGDGYRAEYPVKED